MTLNYVFYFCLIIDILTMMYCDLMCHIHFYNTYCVNVRYLFVWQLVKNECQGVMYLSACRRYIYSQLHLIWFYVSYFYWKYSLPQCCTGAIKIKVSACLRRILYSVLILKGTLQKVYSFWKETISCG